MIFPEPDPLIQLTFTNKYITGISLNNERKARPTLCSVFIYRYMLRVALSFILSSSFLPLLYLIVFLLSLLPYISFFAFSLFIFSLFLSLLSVFFRLLTS